MWKVRPIQFWEASTAVKLASYGLDLPLMSNIHCNVGLDQPCFQGMDEGRNTKRGVSIGIGTNGDHSTSQGALIAPCEDE